MFVFRPRNAIAVMLALAGCGSDSTPPATYNDISLEGDALRAEFAGAPLTSLANLPDTGSFNYSGVFQVSEIDIEPDVEGEDLAGQLRLTADFASNSISGNILNVVNSRNEIYEGSVSITGDILREEFPRISSTSVGILIRDGVTLDVSALFDGRFVGEAYEGITGDAGISIRENGSFPRNFDGTFVVQR
ncbi:MULTISPECIES: hypothetical protein [unclassified Yoonia]|uniref:hypothetical protein n=1 Tax=unclassified Yoonia TaxID=2629118 RepID=UPI002AFE14DD|nr:MULTISPECIES: hypothetical protein [unclassified Yoonia]